MSTDIYPKGKNGEILVPNRVVGRLPQQNSYKEHPSHQKDLETLKRIDQRKQSSPKEMLQNASSKQILKSQLFTRDRSLLNDIALGRDKPLLLNANSFEVMKIQQALKEVKLYQGGSHGDFNRQTESAVKKFQQRYDPTHNIHAQYALKGASGVVDSNTVLALDEAIIEQWDGAFSLGWMQSPATQSQEALWVSLFTDETQEEQKQYIKQCNAHLNEPVRQGEIVLLPTTKPETPEEQSLFDEWLEEAKIASEELGKLLDDEVATLNRHFELFSHQLDERIRKDGLPTDYYAQVATGVGATSALVEQNLKNIQNVLLEINDLYASQVAMASRTGGINYGTFVADRAEMFKKLDGSFAMLSKRSVQLPVYTQIKRNLKLSTKSVIHNADEILKTGFVKNLGKRIGNMAIGISAARGLGYVGLLVGANSGLSNIYEACKVDNTGDCGRTTTREVGGFIGSVAGGIKGGSAGVGLAVGAVILIVGTTASAPVLALAALGGVVTGGFVGGVVGGAAGKALGDGFYDFYEWLVE